MFVFYGVARKSHQKNRCFPSVMSRYPEYCLTDESQRVGSVNLSE
jgi:hypothetical protein